MLNCIIGVDAGGSKTHAVLVDATGKTIAQSFSGPGNIKTNGELAYTSIITTINDLIHKHNIDIKTLKVGLGIAGYVAIKTHERERFKQSLEQLYPKIILASDCHIACLAAHGNSNGAVIVCGTGVVTYYIKDGIGKQIGGWGFPHGDIGGGAWLGLELCRLLCKAIDKVIPLSPLLIEIFEHFMHDKEKYKEWLLVAKPNDYATIAKLMVKYINDDPNAKQVFNKGVDELGKFIHAVEEETNGISIKLSGGLGTFYLPELIKTFPLLTISDTDSARGACLLF